VRLSAIRTVRAAGLLLAWSLAASCGGDESSTPTSPDGGTPTPQACRTYSSAETRTLSGVIGGVPFSGSETQSCTYSRSANELTCTTTHVDSQPRSYGVTTSSKYGSVGDFIDEVKVVPPLSRVTTQSASSVPTKLSADYTATFTYDSQRRLRRVVYAYSIGNTDTRTFTAWDGSGRPTAGASSLGATLSYAYDSSARTSTLTSSQNSVLTQTYDANGNIIRQTLSAGTALTTTSVTITSTATVCN
jgi:YD repeat-containing protein